MPQHVRNVVVSLCRVPVISRGECVMFVPVSALG